MKTDSLATRPWKKVQHSVDNGNHVKEYRNDGSGASEGNGYKEVLGYSRADPASQSRRQKRMLYTVGEKVGDSPGEAKGGF